MGVTLQRNIFLLKAILVPGVPSIAPSQSYCGIGESILSFVETNNTSSGPGDWVDYATLHGEQGAARHGRPITPERNDMFSGIIERLAKVRLVEPDGASLKLTLETGYGDLELGESIAVNGVCLTVTSFSSDGKAEFFVSPETIARSNLLRVAVGDLANMERSVRLDTRLSGHLVQGHVDGIAELVLLAEEAEAHRLEFEIDDEIARYCVNKGSIAVNGVSLTINGMTTVGTEKTRIGVSIIPHTLEYTNFHRLRVGDRINIEVDVVAKYVERLCWPHLKH
jgi:riboflavin synthase